MTPSARPTTIVCRADASAAMGAGHVMRTLALAQAWHDLGHGVVFVMAPTDVALEARLAGEGFEVMRLAAPAGSAADAAETSAVVRDRGAAWIVLDGYQFDADYQARLTEGAARVAVVDDYAHAGRYAAAVVVNPNFYARADLYANRDRATRLLMGPRYALLRREFVRWRGWRRPSPDALARRDDARRATASRGGGVAAEARGRRAGPRRRRRGARAATVVAGRR